MGIQSVDTVKQPFIVFEGLSGSGKTTIAKLLATAGVGIYISSSPDFITHIRKVLGRDRNLEERLLCYLLGNIHCSEVARQMRIICPVICDRYFHSTVAIHALLGVSVELDVTALGLLQPDISFFFFTSDEQERKKRVDFRNKKNKYDVMLEDDRFRLKYVDYFRSAGGFIFIDTAGKSEGETLAEVKKHLLDKFPNLTIGGNVLSNE